MGDKQVTRIRTAKALHQQSATNAAKQPLPTRVPVHPLLQLQRQIGNQAVTRLIQAKLTIGEPGDKYEQEADRVAAQVVSQINAPTPQQSSQGQTVQRQEMPQEEELQTKPQISSIQRQEMPEDEKLQTKLEVGSIQRQEMPEDEKLQTKPEISSIQRQEMPEDEKLQTKSMVQHQPSGAGMDQPSGAGMAATPQLEASIQQARGGGQPLSERIRKPMEQAFGADFSGVRVHTDAQSDELNQSIQAKAFTTGQDIFFRRGEYDPENRKELIAHELTHVVQQSGGGNFRSSTPLQHQLIQRKLTIEQHWIEGWTRKEADRFRSQVLASLNQILKGSGVQATINSNGEVTLTGNPEDQKDVRFVLLNNVIQSPRNVLVRRIKGAASTDIDREGSQETVKQRLQDATNTKGTDAVILFDPSHTDMVPTTEGSQQMPSWLILGHELVHGSRIQGGRAAVDPETGERHVGVYKNLRTNQPEIGHIEEMQTVGLSAYTEAEIEQALSDQEGLQAFNKSEKANRLLKHNQELVNEVVTENGLRDAHEMSRRSGYETVRQDVLVPKHQPNQSLRSALDSLDRMNRHRSPNTGQLAMLGVFVLAGFVSWYYSDRLGSMFQSKPVQRQTVSRKLLQSSPSDVVQRIGVRPKQWNDAIKVEALREGVYKVTGSNNAIIVKTSADTDSPLDEAVGAHVGRMIGANTVVPEVFATNGTDLEQGIQHLEKLNPHGKLLSEAVTKVKQVLVMPFIPSKDLAKAGEEIGKGTPEQKKKWGQELGRIFVLDLVLLNPDRHGDNILLADDGALHAIDQVAGPMARGEASQFVGEKMRGKLSDLQRLKKEFFKKVLPPEMQNVDVNLLTGFNAGVEAARTQVLNLRGEDVDSIYALLLEEKGKMTAPGIAKALPIIAEMLPAV